MRRMTLEELKSELQSTQPGQQYIQVIQKILLEKRPVRKKPGFELHHIHPRGLGGAVKDKENLIRVTCFEHCLLHALLMKAIPCAETALPLARMAKQYWNCIDPEKITLEEVYEWSKLRSQANKSVVGRKRTEESRKKMSEAHRGLPGSTTGRIRIHKGREGKIIKPDYLSFYLDDGWEIGVPERTPEYRKNLSEACKRRPKPSEASKQKNREAHLGKPGGNKGRIFIHKGEKELKRISPEELGKYLAEGWERGHHPSWYQNKTKCRHDAEWRRKVSETKRKNHEEKLQKNDLISNETQN